MSVEHLGEPLTGIYSIPGGQARLFECGVTIYGERGEAVVGFAFPMIGSPGIVTGDPTKTPLFDTHAIRCALGLWGLDQLTSLIMNALSGRLSLMPTGQLTNPVPLTIGPATVVTADIYGFPVTSATLQERQLYDVAVLADDNQWRIVAPHAVYFRWAWTDFAIAHITDLHVARRIDRFRELLVQAARHVGAQSLYNWNDRFRGFVRYANYLHATGMLDIIISTGDQYDYIYEDDDDPAGGGNAAFMRQLILGRAPGPDFPDVEELLVPIFMIPGNHDYRKHPYKLIFDLHVGALGIGKDLERIKNVSGYHLPQADAPVLQNLLDKVPDIIGLDHVQNVGLEGAARMVDVDKDIKAYKEFLADRDFYVVRLGNHRIVMLNSGPDEGVLTSVMDGLRHVLGRTTEDENTFANGSPNSEGVSPIELGLVSKALAETPDDGLVILGLHTPLLNPINEEYPYFLRETQRPAQPDQVHAFLARHDISVTSTNPLEIEKQVKARHPTWFAGERDHRAARFVKRVDSQDMLDFAVSRGNAEELIRLLAGVGSRRPADLVLSGHTHYLNEFSVRTMWTGELAFYMDFYTQNPVNYYPTRFAQGWKKILPSDLYVPETDKTYIEVLSDAAPDSTPGQIDDAPLNYDLKVPPYPNPLDSAPNPGAWWSEHRPLLVQTPALGPFKMLYFSGFRLLSVKNNIIDKIHFVSIARLEANNYRLAWDEAIAPDVSGPPSFAWQSVSEGMSSPGGHVTAIATGEDRITLFLADPNGGIYANSGNYRAGWGPWRSVLDGLTTPGAPVPAVMRGDHITAFVSGITGEIWATSGTYKDGWAPWRSVLDGLTTPGGHLTPVIIGDRIALFVAGITGEIWGTSGTYEDGWAPWKTVSEGSSTPGAPVAAVVTRGHGPFGVIPDRITLFLADPGGGIYTTSGTYEGGWGPWRSVSEGSSTPGGHVTAVVRGDRVTLFLVDPNGGIYANSGNYQDGWGPWRSVSEGSSTPGGHVTAVVLGDRIALFLADPGGGIYTTSGTYEDGWGPWRSVAEGSSTPGAPVTAVVTGGRGPFGVIQERINLFLADPGGGIYGRTKPL